MSLDATLGSSTADSYVASVSEADAIVALFSQLPGMGVDTTGWLHPGSPMATVKEFALKQAAVSIDSALLVGSTQTRSQSRQWPRLGVPVVNMNRVIPDAVKYAQVAEACSFMNDMSAESQAPAGLISETDGNKSKTFDRATLARERSRTISVAAEKILDRAGFVRGAGGVTSVYLPRG